MLISAVELISKHDKSANIYLLSMYPEADKRLNEFNNLHIVRANPVYLGLVINPLALLYKLVPPLRGLLRMNRSLKAIVESDVLLDQGGITFADGREKFLIYNIATILPALLVGAPVVKCSQAMGPFKTKINKAFSNRFLPKIHTIVTRGEKTHKFTEQLGLRNTVLLPDLAFSLKIDNFHKQQAKSILAEALGNKPDEFVCLVPSAVLYKKAKKQGIDYIGVMAKLVDNFLDKHPDKTMLILPHSAKLGENGLHNNDLPIVRKIYKRVRNQQSCSMLEGEYDPRVLRSIISRSELTVACRFHAMVSALSVGKPVFVIGWSHKYEEVLDMFGVKDISLKFNSRTTAKLSAKFDEIYSSRQKQEKQISDKIKDIQKDSAKHIDVIKEAVSKED